MHIVAFEINDVEVLLIAGEIHCHLAVLLAYLVLLVHKIFKQILLVV